jgi:hypothetical protein
MYPTHYCWPSQTQEAIQILLACGRQCLQDSNAFFDNTSHRQPQASTPSEPSANFQMSLLHSASGALIAAADQPSTTIALIQHKMKDKKKRHTSMLEWFTSFHNAELAPE